MKIVLTGGGTAGHVTAHLAMMNELRQNFDEIYYIGSERGIEKELMGFLPYRAITTVKFRRGFAPSNLLIPFKLARGISDAKKLLKEIKPDVVFSKGGYVALPVVFAASSLKIPVAAHESDLSAGLSNRLTARRAKAVFTSFPETAKKIRNGVYSGCPVRKEFFSNDKARALKLFGFSGKKPVLLVTGGSLGSARINEALLNNLNIILKDFDVLHITGRGKQKKIREPNYHSYEFIGNMPDALAVADVAISRAGANTVFELLAARVPSLLVPLKNGSRGDQIENAEYFYKRNLCGVLDEDKLNSIVEAITKVYSKRAYFTKNMRAFTHENADKFIVGKLKLIAEGKTI